ncbi:MAG: hypothetical protein WCF57_07690 [Pyrinomonadaceae bacterium]
MKPELIFVYNASSGLFNLLTDAAHKILSPATYSCHLCALTHTNFGMRQEWKQFIERLDTPVEFLHADELKERYGLEAAPLPAVFKKEEGAIELWIDRDAINSCRTLDELKELILSRQRSPVSPSNPR